MRVFRWWRLLTAVTLLAAAGLVGTASPAAASHTATSVSPTNAAQGVSDIAMTITGSGFTAAGLPMISVSGTGVTVTDVDVVNSTTLTGQMDVAAAAATGVRDVTVTQFALDSVTCSGCLTILPRPIPTSITPSAASNTSAGPTNVTVGGASFAAGAQLQLVNGPYTIEASEGVVTATSLTATLNLQGQPPGLLYDVVVTNPDTGQGQLNNGFSIGGSAPTLTAVTSPIGQGATNKTLQLTGTNLARGATVTFTPSLGITVGQVTYVSPTRLDVPVSVAPSATTGARTVTVTNTDTQSAACPACTTISTGPTITSVAPNARAVKVPPRSMST